MEVVRRRLVTHTRRCGTGSQRARMTWIRHNPPSPFDSRSDRRENAPRSRTSGAGTEGGKKSWPRVPSRASRVRLAAPKNIPGNKRSHKSPFTARPRRSTSFRSMHQPSGLARGLAAYFSCQSRPRVPSRASRVRVAVSRIIPGTKRSHKRAFATCARRSTSGGSKYQLSGLARGLAAYFFVSYPHAIPVLQSRRGRAD